MSGVPVSPGLRLEASKAAQDPSDMAPPVCGGGLGAMAESEGAAGRLGAMDASKAGQESMTLGAGVAIGVFTTSVMTGVVVDAGVMTGVVGAGDGGNGAVDVVTAKVAEAVVAAGPVGVTVVAACVGAALVTLPSQPGPPCWQHHSFLASDQPRRQSATPALQS